MFHGDIRLGDTIDIKFTSRTFATGAPGTLSSSPVISAYPGNSTTELTAGITLSVDFDSRTGLNNVRVVASSGNGYATATNYTLVITTGTVGGVSVVGECIGSFSIENRSAIIPATAARPLLVDASGNASIDMAQALPANPTANTTGEALFLADILGGRFGTAQAGAASTITLDSGASAVDGRYVGYGVFLYGGTGGGVRGVGQERTIVAYNGTTKVATVAQAWGTNPDSTSKFMLIVNPFTNVGMWNGTAVSTPATAGIPDVNAKNLGGTSQTGRDVGASVLLSSGTGTGQLDFTSGVVKSNLVQILATALTETAGQIAAGFKKFFNIATPAATMDHLILVDTATTLTNAPGDTAGTTTLLARLSAARASYLDNLNVGGNVAASSEVTGLNINTRVNLLVPEEIETPDASTQVYKIRLHLYDPVGNMEAPDSTPTIALTNQGGTDRSSRLSVASNPSTGVYTWDYTATAGDTEEQLVWLFSVVEAGVTRTYPANSYVVEESLFRFSSTDRTNLGAIKTKTDQFAFSTPNRVDAQVFGVQPSAIDAAAIATDAIDADALKADAVTEIQAGLSTLTAAGVRAAVGLASANLDTQLDALPTANENADQVWDEATSGHTTPGTTGKALTDASSAGTPPTAIAIANEVQTRTIAAVTLVNGLAANTVNAAAVAADAGAEIAVAVRAELAAELARIDVATSTRLPTASYTAPDNAGIGVAAAAAASAATDAAAVAARLTPTRAANLDNLDAAVSGIPTAAENADGLLARSIAGGADDTSGPEERSVRSALRAGRNKRVIIADVLTVYEEDDATLAWTANVTTNPTDPISAIDPT